MEKIYQYLLIICYARQTQDPVALVRVYVTQPLGVITNITTGQAQSCNPKPGRDIALCYVHMFFTYQIYPNLGHSKLK